MILIHPVCVYVVENFEFGYPLDISRDAFDCKRGFAMILVPKQDCRSKTAPLSKL